VQVQVALMHLAFLYKARRQQQQQTPPPYKPGGYQVVAQEQVDGRLYYVHNATLV